MRIRIRRTVHLVVATGLVFAGGLLSVSEGHAQSVELYDAPSAIAVSVSGASILELFSVTHLSDAELTPPASPLRHGHR